MNLCVCPEAGITFTAHIVRFHPPFCCDPYCCNPPWQLKAVRGWFSVYRSQNVCQTFLTLHHSLGELHQPHSIFRLWENPMTHAPLMTSPSVNLTAPLGFPWPIHLNVTYSFQFYMCCISLSGWSAPLPLWHKHPVTTRWRGQPGHGKPKGAVKFTDGEVIRGAWVIGFSQSLKIECGWCNSPREWCNVKNVWQTFWDL